MVPTGGTGTSVTNCHYSLRNDPEERSSQLLRGGRLKSWILITLRRTVRLVFDSLKPNDSYRRRTAPLTSKVAFYIFIQQI